MDRWRAAHQSVDNAPEKIEPNLAAGGFLELLERLCAFVLEVSYFFYFFLFSYR